MTPLETQVLEDINTIRATLKLKPARKIEKGDRFNTISCPIARTIKGRSKKYVSVNKASVYVREREDIMLTPTKIRTTDAMSSFIHLFDSRDKFQEYLKED